MSLYKFDNAAKPDNWNGIKWFFVLFLIDLQSHVINFQGKPVSQARGEIAYGGSFIDWFAEEAKRTYGDIIPTHVAGRRLFVVKEAAGVSALWVPVGGVKL